MRSAVTPLVLTPFVPFRAERSRLGELGCGEAKSSTQAGYRPEPLPLSVTLIITIIIIIIVVVVVIIIIIIIIIVIIIIILMRSLI